MTTELATNTGIWDDCKLGREEVAKRFTNLLHNTEGSKVIALNAPYGFGKTFFLDRWAKHLEAEENTPFVVIQFSAWDVDFADHALVPLIYTLMEELKNQKLLDEQSDLYAKFSRVATDVVKHVLKEKTGVDVESISSGDASFEFNNFKKRKESMADFKSALKEVVAECSSKKDQKLVIIIDELERCRPTFAVQLLEVVKHLFDVEDIIFVLGTNRIELSHTVKSIYGSEFNGYEYLRRFIDVELKLPQVDVEHFVDALACKYKWDTILTPTEDYKNGIIRLKNAIIANYHIYDDSLRNVEQYCEEIDIVLRAYLNTKHQGACFPDLLVSMVFLKNKDLKIYLQSSGGVNLIRQKLNDLSQHKPLLNQESYRSVLDTLVESRELKANLSSNRNNRGGQIREHFRNYLEGIDGYQTIYEYFQKQIELAGV